MSMNFNRLSTDDKILIMEGAQVLGDVVAIIPMAALVAVMIMVASVKLPISVYA